MLKQLLNKYKSIPTPARASIWFLFCSFLGNAVSFITTPIFTRLLSTEEYGQYSVFNSWMNVLTPIVTLSLYYGVYMQGLVKFEDEKKEYASSLQGLCLTLVAGWTAVYLLFHDFINKILSLTTEQVLAMLILMWTSAVFSFWSGEQRVDTKYHALVAVTIVATIAKPLLGIILVISSGDKVTARILGLVLVNLVMYTGLFVLQMRRGKKFFSKKYWKYALCFNIPLIPHYLSTTVLSSADRIMIEKLDGSASAGIYNLAYSISMIMTMFNTALMQTIEPWLYKQIKGKKLSNMAKIAYPAFVVIAVVNLCLIAFAPEVVAIFAPEDYYAAIWVIPPIAMSVYFMFAYSFFGVFEFYFAKTKYITLATTIGAVANIVLNYIFIDLFGYYAAGYTTLFCYILFAVFHYLFMRKLCRDELEGEYPYKTKVLLIITLLFMIIGFILLMSYKAIVIRYLLVVIGVVLMLMKKKEIIKLAKMLLDAKKEK